MNEVLLKRFESKFMPEPNSGCWLWTGALSSWGYGRMGTPGGTKTASRLSWQFYRGEIPDGMFVCHKCDNPACVNPDHLFLGSPKENIGDMDRKGRRNTPRGENAGTAKLSAADVQNIRASALSVRLAAKHFGVSKSLISAIRTRVAWAHV